jgi:hypothetical protein
MAGRDDLDAVERHASIYDDCDDCKTREMAAELRVAREVIDQLPDRYTLNAIGNGSSDDRIRLQLYAVSNALAAYDQHVQSSEAVR